MNRLLFILLTIFLFAFPAQATKKHPGYARDKAIEMRSGDWHLLCGSRNACAIRGVAKKLKRPAQSRALVMLDRAAAKDADWQIRIVFLDNAGRDESKQALPKNLRLSKTKQSHDRVPVALELEGGGGNPVQYLPHRRTPMFLAMLVNSKRTEIREQGTSFATMPRGNLRKLLDRAEREQRTHVAAVDPEEMAENGGPPRFDVDVYTAEDPAAAAKPELQQPCGKLDARRNRTWRLAQGARLWLVDCPQETKAYRQMRGGPIQQLLLDDIDGKRHHPREVDYDSSTGLMTMIVRKKGRSDCGYQISWGWTADEDFALIKSTTMPFCRNIPRAYWPTLWEAESWRIIGSLLDHDFPPYNGEAFPRENGDCPPEPDSINATEGI